MEERKRRLIRIKSREHGFASCALVGAEAFDVWQSAAARQAYPDWLLHDVRKQQPGTQCIAVLYWPYTPFGPFPAGYVPYPAYYIASNAAYHAAKRLACALRQEGIAAEAFDRIPQRAAALRGAHVCLGKNALLYHAQYGSYFALATLLLQDISPETDAHAPDRPMDKRARQCLSCRRCIKACPTGAIQEQGFCYTQCIRYWLDEKPLIHKARGVADMILGCDVCQRVCPMNSYIPPAAPAWEAYAPFSLQALLCGGKDTRRDIACLVGANLANRAAEQARLLFEKGI
ncbi:MAG: 4Fe-4S double cluster binding domain-containing protein [Christensenellales bacterium]|jgi:epoxyqueuosine reductase QueG